jgi:hypothetical protein
MTFSFLLVNMGHGGVGDTVVEAQRQFRAGHDPGDGAHRTTVAVAGEQPPGAAKVLGGDELDDVTERRLRVRQAATRGGRQLGGGVGDIAVVFAQTAGVGAVAAPARPPA